MWTLPMQTLVGIRLREKLTRISQSHGGRDGDGGEGGGGWWIVEGGGGVPRMGRWVSGCDVCLTGSNCQLIMKLEEEKKRKGKRGTGKGSWIM